MPSTRSYPKPPFNTQPQQPEPGVEARMDPMPDHGETSYDGRGKLAREGADVLISYLEEEHDAFGRLDILVNEGRIPDLA